MMMMMMIEYPIVYLYFSGADINITTDDATPLYTAAKENHPDCVEHLLEQGASITISRAVDSTDDESLELAPIHIAAGKGHMRSVKVENLWFYQ